jgi:hypothetical protein
MNLGRIASPTDYRDHQFLARSIAPLVKPGIVRRRWFVPPAWDQQETLQCVAFSSLLWLNAGPVRNREATSAGTSNYYEACQQLDGIALPHEGSTVRASMQVAQSMGYITGYRWAFTVEDVAQWILTSGPCVLGTDWLNSMFDTQSYRRKAFIKWDAGSGIAGGHAYCAFAVDLNCACPDGTKGAVEMQNSWGMNWGVQGRAWLSFTALRALLAENGECSMANEIVRKTTPA